MIGDSIEFLRGNAEVIYDAEHFFDGYNANPEYAIADIAGRRQAGATLARVVRHQWRHVAGTNRRVDHEPQSQCYPTTTSKSASTATTTANWRLPIHWPPSTPVPRRSREPSTASANAAATST